MSDSADAKPKSLPSLDVGRFYAALLVALFHMSITTFNFTGIRPFDMALFGGRSGVNYFFVLSGFIIVYVHRRDIGVPGRVMPFFRKRVVRIVPLLWATMIGWGAIRILAPGGTGVPLPPLSILLDCFLIPHKSEQVIGAIWTLRRELVFYLLFALVLVDRRAGIWALIAWQAAVVVQAIHPFFRLGPEPEMLLGIENLGFGAGMALAVLVPTRPLPCPHLLIWAGAGLYAATIASEWWVGADWDHGEMAVESVPHTLLYFLASSLLVAGMVSRDVVAAPRTSRVASILGGSSYALYLTQGPVGSIAIRAYKPLWHILPAEALLLLLTLTTILVAIAVNRLFEKPIARLLRDGWRPTRPEGAPAN